MGDSDRDTKVAVPEWQRAKPQQVVKPTSSSSNTSQEAPVTIEQAKRFLQDEEVRKYSREKQFEFLKNKGFEEGLVQRLLQGEPDEAASQVGCSEPSSLYNIVLTSGIDID